MAKGDYMPAVAMNLLSLRFIFVAMFCLNVSEQIHIYLVCILDSRPNSALCDYAARGAKF